MKKHLGLVTLFFLLSSSQVYAKLTYFVARIELGTPMFLLKPKEIDGDSRSAMEKLFFQYLSKDSESHYLLIQMDELNRQVTLLDSKTFLPPPSPSLFADFRNHPSKEYAKKLWDQFKIRHYNSLTISEFLQNAGYNTYGELPKVVIPYLSKLSQLPFEEERKFFLFFENMLALVNN